jgi:hypothetical protein
MKKRIALIIAVSFISISPLFAQYSGGDGSEADPWQVSCPNDLLYLGSHPADYNSCFILTADVNLAGYTFTTAVIAPEGGTYFTGTFNGSDFVIRNLVIDTDGAGNSFLGLFGSTDFGSQIKNLGIEDVNITGGFASYYLGGLVGFNLGIISNCYATGEVTGGNGSAYLGGLVGDIYSGAISDCYATGSVFGGDGSAYLGGLVGYNKSGTISGCNAAGAVTGGVDSVYLGGLAGENHSGTIRNCYATGAVTGGDYLGGLVGDFSSGAIINCHATGSVLSGEYFTDGGGLVGYNDSGTISNCYATGAVTGGDNSGGLGGLVGCNLGTISNSYATGAVTGGIQSQDLGGLMGGNLGTISNSYATGAVTGGIQSQYLGGLVGGNWEGKISDCYAMGAVNGIAYLGGLAGANTGTINNCYSTGTITGGDGSYALGGLVGYNSGTISNCFWDKQTSGRSNGVGYNQGGTITNLLGKTTGEMQKQSTFTGPPAYWDFVGEAENGTNDIWRMCIDDVNYPLLNWQFINGRGDFVCPDGVDFFDYAVLANAWLSTPSDDNWNLLCDLQPDEIIETKDLQILIEHWLE